MTSNASMPAGSEHGDERPRHPVTRLGAAVLRGQRNVAIAGNASQAIRASTAARGHGSAMAAGRLMHLTLGRRFRAAAKACLAVVIDR